MSTSLKSPPTLQTPLGHIPRSTLQRISMNKISLNERTDPKMAHLVEFCLFSNNSNHLFFITTVPLSMYFLFFSPCTSDSKTPPSHARILTQELLMTLFWLLHPTEILVWLAKSFIIWILCTCFSSTILQHVPFSQAEHHQIPLNVGLKHV